MFKLYIKSEGEPEYSPPPFDQDVATLGRRADNDLVLTDDNREVSNYHARIEKRGEVYVLIDRSTNGTLVDDERIAREVPFTLTSGNIIQLGPYTLRYETLATSDVFDQTIVSPSPMRRGDQLAEELSTVYAQNLLQPIETRRQALKAVLQQKRASSDSKEMCGVLQKLSDQYRAGDDEDFPSSSPSHVVNEEFYTASLRVLRRISARLVGDEEFRSAGDIELFGQLIEQFLDMTSQWMLRSVRIRREARQSLSADVTKIFKKEPNPIESSQSGHDVARMMLNWADEDARPEGITDLLTRVFRDLTLHQIGMLQGGQAVIRQILDSAAPETLEDRAWKKCSAIGKMGMKMALNSQLWEEYREAYKELTEDKRAQDEIILTQMRNEYLRTYSKMGDSDIQEGSDTR